MESWRTRSNSARIPSIALGFVDEATFDAVVRPEQMIGPKD